jgi:tripartite-type tricarboxylate transporter receptor subunit TctC
MARMAAMMCCGLAAIAPLGATTAIAADYPVKPIRLVVGFGAGGPTDIPARFIADKLGEKLGQRVFVENKPVAAGMVATRDVLSQPRDGYTLLLCTHFEPINIASYTNVGFKLDDIAPISLIAEYYYALALSLRVPAEDFASFVQYDHRRGIGAGDSGAAAREARRHHHEPDSVPGRTAGRAGDDRRARRFLCLADARGRAAI